MPRPNGSVCFLSVPTSARTFRFFFHPGWRSNFEAARFDAFELSATVSVERTAVFRALSSRRRFPGAFFVRGSKSWWIGGGSAIALESPSRVNSRP